VWDVRRGRHSIFQQVRMLPKEPPAAKSKIEGKQQNEKQAAGRDAVRALAGRTLHHSCMHSRVTSGRLSNCGRSRSSRIGRCRGRTGSTGAVTTAFSLGDAP
jgi:hypothetical protein